MNSLNDLVSFRFVSFRFSVYRFCFVSSYFVSFRCVSFLFRFSLYRDPYFNGILIYILILQYVIFLFLKCYYFLLFKIPLLLIITFVTSSSGIPTEICQNYKCMYNQCLPLTNWMCDKPNDYILLDVCLLKWMKSPHSMHEDELTQ